MLAMKIDSHQHFWKYSAREYPWIGPGMERLARDYLPTDLVGPSKAAGIGGTVAVQARQTEEETRWLLALSEAHPLVRGVVGWVDLTGPGVAESLAHFAAHDRFVGVRHVVQDEPDPRFLLGEAFVRGLRHLHAFGLVYDLLLYPPQLPAAVELVGLLPEQPFVLDHLAKPKIGTWSGPADRENWRREIAALARHDNVAAKLSGLVTEAARRGWKRADFLPYLEVALDAFGPGRLMFGSDWPVCLLAAEHADVVGIVADFVAGLSAVEREQVWGGTAARVYGLGVD